MSTRQERADANLNVPSGVGGRQRAAYLALTDEQKRHYRYAANECRPMSLCGGDGVDYYWNPVTKRFEPGSCQGCHRCQRRPS